MVQEPGKRTIGSAAHARAIVVLLVLVLSQSAFADSHGGNAALSPAERARVATVPYSSTPLRNRSGRFDTRFEVPAHLDWREIFERPQIIKLSIDPVPGHPTRQLSIGDVQGVFPVPAQYFYEALSSYDSYPQINRRTVYDVGRGDGTRQNGYHKRVLKISAQFLGFGESYLFVTNNYASELANGSYGLKWNLEQSLDGKFFSLTGSWYVKPLRCDGRACSYVRYFNATGFEKRPPVPTSILALVTGASFRNLLTDFYHAALAIAEASTTHASRETSNNLLTVH